MEDNSAVITVALLETAYTKNCMRAFHHAHKLQRRTSHTSRFSSTIYQHEILGVPTTHLATYRPATCPPHLQSSPTTTLHAALPLINLLLPLGNPCPRRQTSPKSPMHDPGRRGFPAGVERPSPWLPSPMNNATADYLLFTPLDANGQLLGIASPRPPETSPAHAS